MLIIQQKPNHGNQEAIQVVTKPLISLTICSKSIYPFIMFKMHKSLKHVFAWTQRNEHLVSNLSYAFSFFLYAATP